jgi:hypothetical protein
MLNCSYNTTKDVPKKEKGNAGHKAPEDKEYSTHVCLRPEVPKAKQMPLCLYYTKPKHV